MDTPLVDTLFGPANQHEGTKNRNKGTNNQNLENEKSARSFPA